MALGNYGIKRPADVSPNDVEILYHYQPSRDATSSRDASSSGDAGNGRGANSSIYATWTRA